MSTVEPPAPSYAEARSRFLAAAEVEGAHVTHRVHPTGVGPGGEELAIDVARRGAHDAEAVIMVVSGTHGVEGFAGSALQTTWLRSEHDPGGPNPASVLLVHALNPYGFAWCRRVDEENVDVNRNFVDFDEPLPSNPGYDEIADLLVPVRWDDESRRTSTTALVEHALAIGGDAMQEAVTRGQHSHPSGLCFGGTRPSWSRIQLEEICRDELNGARRVVIIDLHTGLGSWGHGELISSQPRSSPSYERTVRWYGDEVTSLVDGDSVSSVLSGEWLPHVEQMLHPAEATGIAIEYGTVDLLRTLDALRADAWLHAHGDPVGPEADAIRSAVRRAFCDDDPRWIAACWDRFADVLEVTSRALAGGT